MHNYQVQFDEIKTQQEFEEELQAALGYNPARIVDRIYTRYVDEFNRLVGEFWPSLIDDEGHAIRMK